MKNTHVRYLQPVKFFNGLSDIQTGEVVRITRTLGKGAAYVVRNNGDTWAEIGIDGVRAEYCEDPSTETKTRPATTETHPSMKTTYRKNSIEAKLDSLLPQFPSFDVIAHELLHDGDGWSVNDSWYLARGCDREEAIGHLANRWQVFKANYAPKARVRDLTDSNYSGDEFPSLLEVDGIPFAEVRNGADDESETEGSTQDASLNPAGIVQLFLESDHASDIEESDRESVRAHFEHGQWWIQVLATGQSFSVVDVQATNGTRSLAFEQL